VPISGTRLSDWLHRKAHDGRPLGDDRFLARIERATKRRLTRKRGPKPRTEADLNDGSQLNALSPR
jgi:hypothetical protein